MSPSIDAVIFDMDGLLLDTERLALDSYLESASRLGIAATEEFFTSLIGKRWQTTKVLIEDALGREDAERMLSAWTEAFERRLRTEGVRKKPGVDDLLELIRRRGTPAALATSTGRTKTLEQLVSVGLRDRFKAIATGDEVVNGKPSPDIFLLAAERLAVDPQACIALEDSEPGVQAASSAGMRVIMVPDLKQPTAEIRALAERVCNSLAEAQGFLDAHLPSLSPTPRDRRQGTDPPSISSEPP